MTQSPKTKAEMQAAAKARWKARLAMVTSPPAPALIKVPALRMGNPEEVAAKFKELFGHAEDGKLRIAAFGIYANHVKFNLLKHSQFGAWVAATIGDKSYRTVREHMLFAESALKKAGYGKIKALVSKWQSLPICHSGEFLLLPEANIPEQVKPVREKLFSLFAGKSKFQLFNEWKQADDREAASSKSEVSPKPKRGRPQGEGGATKEQRAVAAATDETARVEAISLEAESTAKWLMENADDKHIGAMSEAAFSRLETALETALAYMRPVKAARSATR